MKTKRLFSVKAGMRATKLALVAVISWQMGVGLPVAFAEQSYPGRHAQRFEKNDPVRPEEFTSDLLAGFKSQITDANPLIQDLYDAGPVPQEFRSVFNPAAEGLDKDPFFLRSQKWQTQRGLQGNGDWSYETDKDHVTLAYQNWNGSLRIEAPLQPLLETGDYILFSATKDSRLLESKIPGMDESSEGLFYVNKKDLIQQYQSAKALGFRSSKALGAPVFFFPLPGEGWKGKLNAVEWLMNDEVVIQNASDNTILPIEFKDLQLLEKVQRMNLLMGQVITLMKEQPLAVKQAGEQVKTTGEITPFVLPLPAVDSTKGFGLFLSGKKPAFGQLQKTGALGSEILKRIQNLLLPEAKASGFMETIQSLITPDLWERVHFLNTLLGGAAVGAVALKYSTYKDLFKKKYPTVKGTIKEKVWNEAKGNLDVYTHMLVTVTYTTGMSIVTSVEYLLDRFVTKSAGPKNGLVRKLFTETLGWARAQSSKLATNWKTFFLGALVMGGIDAGLVVVQLLFVTPFLLQWMGWQTAEAASAAAAGTTAVAAFVTSEIIHNIYSYFKTGAFSYSADQKFLVMDQVRILVDRELKRKGLDPTDPEIQAERNKRISQLMNERMAQMGLPTDKDFLFDHNTLIEKVAQASGFGLSKEELKLLKDEVVMQTGRWGLAYPTLKKAYKAALRLQKESPSPQAQATVSTLKKSLANFRMSESTLRQMAKSIVTARKKSSEQLELPLSMEVTPQERETSFMKNPGAYLKAFGRRAAASGKWVSDRTVGVSRAVRKTIALASYGGKFEEVSPLIPKEFVELAGSRETAETSARLIRNSFLSITQGEEELLIPSKKMKEEFSDEAEEILKFRGMPQDRFVKTVAKNEVIKALNSEQEKKDYVANYKPAKQGWFERLQHKRARKFAEQKLQAQGPSMNAENVDANSLKEYQKNYLAKLARISGLYLMDSASSEFTKKVETRAEEALELQLNLPEEKSYMATLSTQDQRAYQAQLFTEHFFDSYFQMSVLSDEHLAPSAPEQPGRFQWLRQKLIGKPGYEKFYHRVLRTGDAFFEDTVYRPGLVNYLSGRVPLVPEFAKMFIRNLRILPYFASFGYVTNYYIWQVKMDYAIWVFYFLIAFYGPVAVALNNRLMKNFGVKPMGDVWSKAKYSFMHSWMTYPTFIPVMMFADPVVNWWNTNISGPIDAAASACAKFLLGG